MVPYRSLECWKRYTHQSTSVLVGLENSSDYFVPVPIKRGMELGILQAIRRAEGEAFEATQAVLKARSRLDHLSHQRANALEEGPTVSERSNAEKNMGKLCCQTVLCNQWLSSTWANARNLVFCNLVIAVRPCTQSHLTIALLEDLNLCLCGAVCHSLQRIDRYMGRSTCNGKACL